MKVLKAAVHHPLFIDLITLKVLLKKRTLEMLAVSFGGFSTKITPLTTLFSAYTVLSESQKTA